MSATCRTCSSRWTVSFEGSEPCRQRQPRLEGPNANTGCNRASLLLLSVLLSGLLLTSQSERSVVAAETDRVAANGHGGALYESKDCMSERTKWQLGRKGFIARVEGGGGGKTHLLPQLTREGERPTRRCSLCLGLCCDPSFGSFLLKRGEKGEREEEEKREIASPLETSPQLAAARTKASLSFVRSGG
jgi:hypothetical protein